MIYRYRLAIFFTIIGLFMGFGFNSLVADNIGKCAQSIARSFNCAMWVFYIYFIWYTAVIMHKK